MTNFVVSNRYDCNTFEVTIPIEYDALPVTYSVVFYYGPPGNNILIVEYLYGVVTSGTKMLFIVYRHSLMLPLLHRQTILSNFTIPT